MATILSNTTAKGIGNYVGETNKQIREGFGVYTYPNKFFRYEGEWKNGQKHGHGRLLMGDGSFYEGSFVDGEIQGSGFRKWSTTNNTYTGQFERGELCGSGIMSYGNGDSYEGGWLSNQREGVGNFIEQNGNIYKGSFHQHKRHGQGFQIYSNGDQYEGEWVKNKKQGHGTMKYGDGTIYDGQWRDDMFNGEGSIIHVSGVMYEGLWVSGKPEVEAFVLTIKGPNNIEVEQGKCFNIEVECQNMDGELAREEGRVLKVMAGMKLPKTVSPDQVRINTPFDFDVEKYPIMELEPGCDPPVAWWTGLGSNSLNTSYESSQLANDDVIKESVDGIVSDQNVEPTTSSTDNEHESGNYPAVPSVRTLQGAAKVENLYLLPLPPGMKSYSSMMLLECDQNQKKRASRSDRRSSIITGDNVDKIEIKESKKKREKKDAEKNVDDKSTYCKAGDYVIIVKDATSPPFLDTVLKPAYLRVKVLSKPKRVKSKEKK